MRPIRCLFAARCLQFVLPLMCTYTMAYSPYHKGELEMQQKTREEIPAYRNSRIILPHIAPGADKFIEGQPFVVVSSQDRQGRLWTSILSGDAGFVTVRDEKTVVLDHRLIHSNPADGFWKNVATHPFAGMLFIELTTRRRYRVNGHVSLDGDKVLVTVDQAYVNCPKYIQRRAVGIGKTHTYSPEEVKGTAFSEEIKEWLQGADTFFVGSSNGAEAMDASHRGGNPGFVEVVDSFALRIPDYAGNSMYNTLGNFLEYPKAGLLFVDFKGHRTLQLTGKATVYLHEQTNHPEDRNTDRHWMFITEAWVLLENLRDLEWTFLDYSPFNPT